MKKGFTLAEVLLALVIIGIIAAVTLPGLKADLGTRKAQSWHSKYCNILDAAVGQLWAEKSLHGGGTDTSYKTEITPENLLPYLQLDTANSAYTFKDGSTLSIPTAGADGTLTVTFPSKANIDSKVYTVAPALEGINCKEFQTASN